jgi:hypothetical protein
MCRFGNRMSKTVSKGILNYVYVPSSENVADILTKCLNRIKIQHFTKAMGLSETADQREVLKYI